MTLNCLYWILKCFFNIIVIDFSAVGSGETFGEEMYEALPGEEQGGSENGFDSLVENKVSPTATPRCYYSNIFLTKCLLIGRGRKSQILRDF